MAAWRAAIVGHRPKGLTHVELVRSGGVAAIYPTSPQRRKWQQSAAALDEPFAY